MTVGLGFDFSSVPDDPTKIQDGGGDRPTPGRGMVLISEFNEYMGAKGQAHEVVMEIVAWTNSQDVAKVHKENIFVKDTSGKGFPMKRLTCLAMAAGLFNANDVKRWKAEGSQPEVDMTKLAGRPIMIELIEEADKNDPAKKYIRVGNYGVGMYHIKDARVKDWPKNQSIYNRCAASVGEWITETKPAAPKQPAAAGADPFAGVV